MRSQLHHSTKKTLEANRAGLLARIGATRQFGIEKHADPVEEARLDAERELTLGTLATATRRLHDVEAALYRIDAGTFGICLHCDGEIEAKRLAAVPWTPLCLQCQRGSEQEAGGSRLGREDFQHRAA
jgi:DnaK suppressor protein